MVPARKIFANFALQYSGGIMMKYARFFFLLVSLALSTHLQAQAKRDTILKVIYGLHSFADLLFPDPELRVNIIEESASDRQAFAISPQTPVSASVRKFHT